MRGRIELDGSGTGNGDKAFGRGTVGPAGSVDDKRDHARLELVLGDRGEQAGLGEFAREGGVLGLPFGAGEFVDGARVEQLEVVYDQRQRILH